MMHKSFWRVLFSLVIVSSVALAETGTQLHWYTDVEAAFLASKKEHKNVMVMVEDPHCRWCLKMKQETLSDPRVQGLLYQYILLKIDRSDSIRMTTLPGLRGPIPSFHFFTFKRELMDKLAGYYQADDFLDYLREINNDDK